MGNKKNSMELAEELKEEFIAKRNERITFFRSIGMKIAGMVACAAVLSTIISSIVFVLMIKKECAGNAELLQSANKLVVILAVATLVFFAILGIIFAKFLTKPMGMIKDLINSTADLNFSVKSSMGRMIKRKDEIGSIAKSLEYMRNNLTGIVEDISAAGDTINGTVDLLEQSGREIDDKCMEASSTTEELAAEMQETSAAASIMQSHITTMQTEASGIKERTMAGQTQSEAIKTRANDLNETTSKASERTTMLYKDMKIKTEQCIDDSKAVAKINELTDAIMSISNQTSMLALNANIEAARAGEAGKGFAVVATEIGSLASQTSDTVTSINEIVSVVNEVVARMASTLTESIDFLENVVIKDYEQFTDVSVQYKKDAIAFEASMEEIEGSITKLTTTIDEVATSLDGIANTITEATVGVTEIAGETSDIAALTANNQDSVGDCVEAVKSLRDITSKFVVE